LTDQLSSLWSVACRLSQTDTRAAAIFVDELDTGDFQGAPQRSFVRRGCWDLSINDLYSTYRSDANLRSFRQI
jgi:hypothetical protein